jgi:hypothetical protein
MVASPRRPLDWITAWEAALPVYGAAAILHAALPPFALPLWIIYYLYGRKVLDGARAAEDPWRGRGSPRPYLGAGAIALAVQLGGVLAFAAGGPASSAVTGTIAGVGALTLPALFLARSAPPGVRDRRDWLRSGVLLVFAASLAAPGVLLGGLPIEGPGATLVYLGQIGLAAASSGAFFGAKRLGASTPAAVARKVPRG